MKNNSSKSAIIVRKVLKYLTIVVNYIKKLISNASISDWCALVALGYSIFAVGSYLGTVKVLSNHIVPVDRTFEYYSNSMNFKAMKDESEFLNQEVFVHATTMRTIIQNDKTKSVLLDRAYITVNEIQPLNENKIRLVVGFVEDELIVYALNNNIGISSTVTMNAELGLQYRDDIVLKKIQQHQEEFLENVFTETKLTLEGGEIREVYRTKVSKNIYKYIPEGNTITINIKINENDINFRENTFQIFYSESENLFKIDRLAGGTGGREIPKIRVLELEIDEWVKGDQYVVDFFHSTSASSTSLFEVGVLPDKTATINLSMHFMYNGDKILKSQLLENIELNIYVPYYNVTYFSSSSNEIFTTIYQFFSNSETKNYKFNSDLEFQEKIQAPKVAFYELQKYYTPELW